MKLPTQLLLLKIKSHSLFCSPIHLRLLLVLVLILSAYTLIFSSSEALLINVLDLSLLKNIEHID